MIDPALKLMIDAVHRYDGYIVQSTGDGIFALFGAPSRPRGPSAARAVCGAADAGGDAGASGEVARAEGTPPIEIRVGVNTGEVVVRSIETGDAQAEYTPIGHTTNLASRMQALAPTGLDRDQRERPASWSKDISRSRRSGRHESRASASRSTSTR